MHAFRSHTCADLNKTHVDQTVRLSGWVHRVRDHGGVLFIDLRDHYGMTQVLCDPDSPVFSQVEAVRSEWCIRIDGSVKARDESLINTKLSTGEIEVYIRDIEVLGDAAELPLMVFGDQDYPEETRLRYRYLDLRREKLQRNMTLRSDVVASIRKRMWDLDFREYQTPIITASSPEGARDFLVPSRQHPGKFYALPQAPQQFKQLIMVSGFDKYFQIAPCFRDEDPRADRSPTDFYQLDLEMSFVEQQDVFDTIQPVVGGIFEEFGGGRKVDQTWEQISYKDAALWYGTDKPDLRNPLKMQRVSDHFRDSGFAIFAKLLEQEGTEIRAIPAPTGGSRKFCDRMNAFAQKEGLPGMGYIFWRESDGAMEAAGPLAKNIGPERTEAIRQQLGLGVGDAAFFLGGKPAAFEKVAGKARVAIGDALKLTDQDRFAFAWIVDFPMYEADEETGKIDFSHNPFSMPQGAKEAEEEKEEESAWEASEDMLKILVVKLGLYKRNRSHLVPKKGLSGQGWVAKAVANDIKTWGCSNVILKSDQERSLGAIHNEVKRLRAPLMTIPGNAPRGESQSNGIVERAVRSTTEQVRAMIVDLDFFFDSV